MTGIYKQESPAFDAFQLGQSACRTKGDLKQKADEFLTSALPKLTAVVNDMELNDSDYLKKEYEGKPLVEAFFIGAYEDQPAVFIRGAILENGILESETIGVPWDGIAVFAGVTGHIRKYVKTHPEWLLHVGVKQANRMIEIEAAAHPDLVGLPVSLGTVDSSGTFRWVQRGNCD
jgi:hypothetical protein